MLNVIRSDFLLQFLTELYSMYIQVIQIIN